MELLDRRTQDVPDKDSRLDIGPVNLRFGPPDPYNVVVYVLAPVPSPGTRRRGLFYFYDPSPSHPQVTPRLRTPCRTTLCHPLILSVHLTRDPSLVPTRGLKDDF